ncbi:MAG: hypothetical protein EAZ71_12130 [Verrucomicrobia bacterium]|nr:MAG: hypothetical protein EAZ71_12130 [Verrucomicrobiota bacterium]
MNGRAAGSALPGGAPSPSPRSPRRCGLPASWHRSCGRAPSGISSLPAKRRASSPQGRASAAPGPHGSLAAAG